MFRIPSMNSSDTSTCRSSPTTTGEMQDPWGRNLLQPTPVSCNPALRSGQKTCGLFDTVKASSRPVASVNSLSGLDFSRMDSLEAIEPGMPFGELFQELPQDITEADYLDSFMDLSNFLAEEAGTKGPSAVAVDVDDEKVTAVDFSGAISSIIKPEMPQETDQVVTSLISDLQQSADYVEVSELDTVNVVDLDLSCGSSTSDHDYVSKSEVAASSFETEQRPAPGKASKPSKEKYRERRDKNNIASRRSRQIRKQKYVEMNEEADKLEVRNEELRKKIVELEDLAKFMKAELIKKMTTK